MDHFDDLGALRAAHAIWFPFRYLSVLDFLCKLTHQLAINRGDLHLYFLSTVFVLLSITENTEHKTLFASRVLFEDSWHYASYGPWRLAYHQKVTLENEDSLSLTRSTLKTFEQHC